MLSSIICLVKVPWIQPWLRDCVNTWLYIEKFNRRRHQQMRTSDTTSTVFISMVRTWFLLFYMLSSKPCWKIWRGQWFFSFVQLFDLSIDWYYVGRPTFYFWRNASAKLSSYIIFGWNTRTVKLSYISPFHFFSQFYRKRLPLKKPDSNRAFQEILTIDLCAMVFCYKSYPTST